MNLDVLIFAAHPDDAELSMGGTIAKLTSNNFKVGIIDLTKGELGTRGSANKRMNEAKTASEILKITIRENLGFKDGAIKFSEKYLSIIISKIRKYKPKILFAPYFNDRHPDHIGTSQLIKEAMFYSGLPKIESKENGKMQLAFRPNKIFYYMQTYEFEPIFIVDITETFETKMKAIYAYDSQFHNPDSKEPETFISNPRFINFIMSRARYYGFKIGKDFGEAFYSEELIELSINDLLNQNNSK